MTGAVCEVAALLFGVLLQLKKTSAGSEIRLESGSIAYLRQPLYHLSYPGGRSFVVRGELFDNSREFTSAAKVSKN